MANDLAYVVQAVVSFLSSLLKTQDLTRWNPRPPILYGRHRLFLERPRGIAGPLGCKLCSVSPCDELDSSMGPEHALVNPRRPAY